MKKVYIYPTYTPSRDKSGNLYIKYFHDAFQNNSKFQLINRLWKIGITSILFNLDAEIFIIQWVDLIPAKRFGKVQFVIFLVNIWLLHKIKKRIIWVLHNKQAHRGKSKIVDLGMEFMAEYADSVVVHSSDGITFFDTRYPQYKGKCSYIPHPVYSQTIYPSKGEKYDYVIWGSISAHKNVLNFIKKFNEEYFFHDKYLLICGRCVNKKLSREIEEEALHNHRIRFINSFISDDLLRKLISQAKIILFTYSPESVLSSGALVYSLNFCKPIIGPKIGNFADMEGIVSCYNSFSDIPYIDICFDRNKVVEYLKNNSWNKFPDKIIEE